MSKTLNCILFVVAFIVFIPTGRSQSISEEELEKFARQLEDSVNSGNTEFFVGTFDFKALIERIILPPEDSLMIAFNDGFKKGIKSGFQDNIGPQLFNTVTGFGLFSYVKSYYKKGKAHLIFRLFSSHGINYHDYEIVRNKDSIKIVDFFVYVTGENLSETLRYMYLSALKAQRDIKKLKSTNEFVPADVDLVQRAKELIQAQEYFQAKNTLEKGSNGLKKSTAYAVLYAQVLAYVDEKEYTNYLKEFRKSQGDNPCTYLWGIDYYLLKKKYAYFMDCVNQLDEKVGGDPLLDAYRGAGYMDMGAFDMANDAFNRVIAAYPNHEIGYTYLLTSHLTSGDYEAAVATLDDFMDQFNYSAENMELYVSDDLLFTESEAFKEWKLEHNLKD